MFSVLLLANICFASDLNSLTAKKGEMFVIQSLIDYSTYEHGLVKKQIEDQGITFSWKFCTFGKFPIEQGHGNYFGDKTKIIGYVVKVEDKFYVGVQFKFDSDTNYYKIITYKIQYIQDDTVYWQRIEDYVNITVDQNGKIIRKE